MVAVQEMYLNTAVESIECHCRWNIDWGRRSRCYLSINSFALNFRRFDARRSARREEGWTWHWTEYEVMLKFDFGGRFQGFLLGHFECAKLCTDLWYNNKCSYKSSPNFLSCFGNHHLSVKTAVDTFGQNFGFFLYLHLVTLTLGQRSSFA